MATHYLACDLGAESGRVMLGTLDAGRISLEELHRFPNDPIKADGALHWNIEALFAVSPIEHIVVTGGPYLDLGLGGGYTLLQESTEIDSRDARLTSYGLTFNVAGYY